MLGVDKEPCEIIIREKLNEEQNKRFNFLQANFEELKLPKTSLIVSNFSLPFCIPISFNYLWNNICDSIVDNGYFLGNFFGMNDDWNGKKNMTFLTNEDIKILFKNYKILYYNEMEYDKETAMGKFKHWHIIEVFAQKL